MELSQSHSLQNGLAAQFPPNTSTRSEVQQEYDKAGAEVGSASALHQATMRVNSLTISDNPAYRKRGREEDDYSFRFDKMSEAPANVPRNQATLQPDEYQAQRINRDDSLNLAFPHLMFQQANSSGSASLLSLIGGDLGVPTPTLSGSGDKNLLFGDSRGLSGNMSGFMQSTSSAQLPANFMGTNSQASALNMGSQTSFGSFTMPSLSGTGFLGTSNLGGSLIGNLNGSSLGGFPSFPSFPSFQGPPVNFNNVGMSGSSFDMQAKVDFFSLASDQPVGDFAQSSLFGYPFNFSGSSQIQMESPLQMQSKSKRAPVAATVKGSKLKNERAAANGEKYVAWSPEQEDALVDAIKELGTSDWEAIAARIPGGHRTVPQCIRHWENKLSPSIKRGQWSAAEDEALRQLVETWNAKGLGLLHIPWEKIKPRIPGRTLKQVRERWRSNLDPGIVRGEWSQEEDETIVLMRDVQGMGWASIARALKGRTEHSVKTRHRSMQRAKRRAWTEKEDRTILEMVTAGRDWNSIANELKNRTAASVQMRFIELKPSHN